MSDGHRTTTWNPRHRDNQPPRVCTKCGEGPVRGRGLCGYHYHVLRTVQHAHGVFEPMFVPVGPTRDRIEALRAAGVGWPRIAQLSGIPMMTLCRLADPDRKLVGRHVAAAIAELDVPTRDRPDPAHAPGARVAILGSRRRVRALARIGYSQDYLLERLGMQPGACGLSKVYSGDRHPTITARKARAIADLYDELRHRRGPSKRAASDARRKGWPPPEAWDDIDDPAAEPDLDRRRMRDRKAAARAAREQWLADTIDDLRAVGRIRTDDDLAAHLGVTVDAIQQARRRAERAAAAADDEAVAS